MNVEFWMTLRPTVGSTLDSVRRAEDEGWDGVGFVDNQSLAAEPFVHMAMAAALTSTIKLSTSVINPLTRHPAVVAAAIATIHAESGGRAMLGIARGDSALAHLGLAPAPLDYFDHYLERLQGYLAGDPVPLDVELDGKGIFRDASTLGIGHRPAASQITWLPAGQTKVPVMVAGTGKKVLSIAARRGDAVALAVGSEPTRVAEGLETIRSARVAHGLPEHPPVSVYVPVFVHPDQARARELIAGKVTTIARFSVLHGSTTEPAVGRHSESLASVRASYDMDQHSTHGSPHARALDEGTIDSYSIAGSEQYCVERLLELRELGVDRFFVMAPPVGIDAAEAEAARRRLTEVVLPAVRAG